MSKSALVFVRNVLMSHAAVAGCTQNDFTAPKDSRWERVAIYVQKKKLFYAH